MFTKLIQPTDIPTNTIQKYRFLRSSSKILQNFLKQGFLQFWNSFNIFQYFWGIPPRDFHEISSGTSSGIVVISSKFYLGIIQIFYQEYLQDFVLHSTGDLLRNSCRLFISRNSSTDFFCCKGFFLEIPPMTQKAINF